MDKIILNTDNSNSDDEFQYQDIAVSEFQLVNYLKSSSADLSTVANIFGNYAGSHIERKETQELIDWAQEPLKEDKNKIAILAGGAGMGKTVVLRDVLEKLIQKGIPVLGLKSDRRSIDTTCTTDAKSLIGIKEDIRSVFEKLSRAHRVVILIVDQIDALSRSMATNRQQLSAYLTLINTIATSNIENIRIIISCRIFDLKHEAEFKQYNNKKEFILSELSDDEVKHVLRNILHAPDSKFSPDLLKLLKTPLHLDVLCRIYQESSSLEHIRTLQDLYLELWNQKLHYESAKVNLKYDSLEKVLFEIAKQIDQQNENLAIPVIRFAKSHTELQFLISEGLIVQHQNQIQFFHQSFFDFCYARYFVERNPTTLIDYILDGRHQGLFIRSKIKQVIAYLRVFSPDDYNKQVRGILMSDDIRYHLKLMIIEMLAFEENPTREEFQIVLKVMNYNESLFIAFFNSIPQIEWLYLFNSRFNFYSVINNENTDLCESARRFLVFSCSKAPQIVFEWLHKIDDYDVRGNRLLWALYRINDYSDKTVLETYYSIKDEFIIHEHNKYHLLQNAISSNLEFVLKEAYGAFKENSPDSKNEYHINSLQDRYDLHFYEELFKQAPQKETFNFFKQITTDLSDIKNEEFGYTNYNIIIDCRIFNLIDPTEDDEHKYIQWMIEWMNNNMSYSTEFIVNEIHAFIKSRKIIFVYIALSVIKEQTTHFLDLTFLLLTNQNFVEDCLNCEYLSSLLEQILKKTYSKYNSNQLTSINQFILTFTGSVDKHKNKNFLNQRKSSPTYIRFDNKICNTHYPYPYWEYNKFQLLSFIQIESVQKTEKIKNKWQELNRRFNHFQNDSNTYSTVHPHSQGIGGLVTTEKYKRFGEKEWYNSCLKYNNLHNFIVVGHANALRDVITEKPNKYISLIKKLIQSSDIHIMYKEKVIEGLIDATYDVEFIWVLFLYIIQNNEASDNEFYPLMNSSRHFAKKNYIQEELITFWIKSIQKPFTPSAEFNQTYDNENKNNKLFIQGINSANGKALIAFIDLLTLDSRKDFTFNFLIKLGNELPIHLKLVALSKLNKITTKITSEKLLQLFICYSKEITTEIYHVAGQIIVNLLDEYFEEMIPFVQETMAYEIVSENLAAYLLYGWFYGHEKSKELLFDLHSRFPGSVKHTISEAFRYCRNSSYKEQCFYILEFYITSKEKIIREAYSNGFNQLSENDFERSRTLIETFITTLDKDRMHSLYSYLKKCAAKFPKECLQIQQSLNNNYKIEEIYDFAEPIRLVTRCYSSIRDFKTTDPNAEYAMDVFDDLLLTSRIPSNLDEFLKEMEK